MNQNPGAEKITLGLEAAMYLHWITCYEHDPERFVSVEPKLPQLRMTLPRHGTGGAGDCREA